LLKQESRSRLRHFYL